MILACVDSSSYRDSVCDHAAWLADRLSMDVGLLHAAGAQELSREDGRQILQDAFERLEHQGMEGIDRDLSAAPLVEAAAAAAPQAAVMGKRGVTNEDRRDRFGSQVGPMVQRLSAPICLAPRLFLPIHRLLVLLDTDLDHTAAIAFLANHPHLSELETRFVVSCRQGEAAEAKLALINQRLPDSTAERLVTPAATLDHAVMQTLAERPSDLIVVSRAVLFPDPQAQLRRLEAGSLWAWRTPVIIC